MAGQKVTETETNCQDHGVGGLPLVIIEENGNVQPDDEWALFRLTDDGLTWYRYGAEFAADIMGRDIKGKPAVVEILRRKTKEEALDERSKLSPEEQERTLLRSVSPRK